MTINNARKSSMIAYFGWAYPELDCHKWEDKNETNPLTKRQKIYFLTSTSTNHVTTNRPLSTTRRCGTI